jgi:deoxyribodipyrimidine photo-lyase
MNEWRDRIDAAAAKEVIQVEGDAVVPVQTTSDKREYAAGTIRLKITKLREDFLESISETEPGASSLALRSSRPGLDRATGLRQGSLHELFQ